MKSAMISKDNYWQLGVNFVRNNNIDWLINIGISYSHDLSIAWFQHCPCIYLCPISVIANLILTHTLNNRSTIYSWSMIGFITSKSYSALSRIHWNYIHRKQMLWKIDILLQSVFLCLCRIVCLSFLLSLYLSLSASGSFSAVVYLCVVCLLKDWL